MTNWRDGGGYYPPGSDTPNAPWNQKDLDVRDEYREQAAKEIEDLLLFEDAPDFYEWSEQLQMVMPYSWFTPEVLTLIDEIEAVVEDRDMRAGMTLLNDEQRDRIEHEANVWIAERAEDIARDLIA
jgi:hypothetical protein